MEILQATKTATANAVWYTYIVKMYVSLPTASEVTALGAFLFLVKNGVLLQLVDK
jgi:hypothetical protein